MNKVLMFLLFMIIIIYHNSIGQDLSPEQIYEKTNDAVVVIYSYDRFDNKISQGSGIIINDKGFIITNYHNFQDADKLEIVHMGKTINYEKIVGVDFVNDILILKVNDNFEKSIDIADIKDLKIGNRIYAIGSPRGFENSISEGIIAGLGRNLDEKRNLIQITSIINHGSSGGAVVNSKGELIGISSYGVDNLYFAIPIDEIFLIKIVNDNSVESEIYLKKANDYYKSNNINDAIYYYNKYINDNKNNPNVYIQRGYAYLDINSFDNSISDFKIALSINEKLSDGYTGIGYYYFKLKKYEESVSEFKKAILLDNNINAIIGKGDLYFELKNYNIAIDEYNKVLNINPNNIDVLLRRGNAYRLLEKYNESLIDFNKAILIDSKNIYAYMYRADTYSAMNMFNNAIDDINKAIILEPNVSKLYYEMGLIYYKLGIYTLAIQYWDIAIKLNTGYYTILSPLITKVKNKE